MEAGTEMRAPRESGLAIAPPGRIQNGIGIFEGVSGEESNRAGLGALLIAVSAIGEAGSQFTFRAGRRYREELLQSFPFDVNWLGHIAENCRQTFHAAIERFLVGTDRVRLLVRLITCGHVQI